MSDEYRIVTAKLKGVSPKAIFVETKRRASDQVVPRSLMHAADDAKLDTARKGDEFTFRLREWKAEELGL